MKMNMIKKECYLIRQDNTYIHIFYKIFFFTYRTKQIKTTETNMKVTYLNSNLYGTRQIKTTELIR